MSNGRIQELDFLRGMAMILVILGHSQVPFDKWIMAFHMPLFFFLSGITSSLKPQKPFLAFIRSRWRRLLVPYLLFETLALILSILLCLVHKDPIDIPRAVVDSLLVRHSIGAAAHTGIIARFWFFPCLFFASIMAYPVMRFSAKPVWKTFFMCALWGVGYLISTYLPGVFPFAIDIAFVAAGFLLLGNILADRTLSLLKGKEFGWDLLFLLIGIVALYFSVLNNPKTVSFFINEYGIFGWMLLGGVGGILASLIVFKYLFMLTKSSKSITWTICTIGFLSIAIFPVHLVVLYFLEHIRPFHWTVLFAVTLIVSTPISLLIKKYMPFLIGERVLAK